MRRILLNLSLLSLIAAPVAAHAVTTDVLTLTETVKQPGGTPLGTTYSLVFPSNPTGFTTLFVGSTFEAFFLDGIPVSTNGGPASLDRIGFATTAAGGGFSDLNNGAINIFNANFFDGSSTAPMFLIGSGIADDGLDTFQYTLSASSGGSAPEPSSLVLLGTGALGLFGTFRRRFVA